ncbi:MAG: aminopeptidase N [Burkholderiaceae bacterium]|nr:aminopeptidase N [Burkholderiaceae bacterium]
MRTDQSIIVRRSDYRPPAFLVDHVALEFDLDPDRTTVRSRLSLRRNPAADAETAEAGLLLNGEDLRLVDIRLDGMPLAADRWRITPAGLAVDDVPDTCELFTESEISPAANTRLEGLYVSNSNFFTQCEAQGFRRITWYPDRPDVMARFTVTLNGPRDTCPTLLSNGNLVAEGDCEGRPGWHWVRWEDPFPKPSYLFALVAGRFECAERRIRTRSGREVTLQIHVEPGNLDRCGHAMDSLVHAIRWDEQRFGLELDLDRFMIVAVGDFNMGAMENKGLNIFNTRYVFANPQIATDADFAHVEAVVGHEYFHNWTGNRVTCRDWFQLTLKEGLTVFRDQEFSADRLASQAGSPQAAASARAVKRIEDVRVLRTAQFAEDAGPMAHPIRPDSYHEINNFYTLTVYEKGAEVIRMLHTLVGEAGFRKGMDLYFERHDGQAVTCDDFVAAIADANGRDLSHFRLWYSQSGTPRLRVQTSHDAPNRRFVVTVRQSIPAQADGQPGQPMHVPLAVGLLGADGSPLPLPAPTEIPDDGERPTTRVLELTEAEHRFTFEGIDDSPVLSVGRGFSAPVIIEATYFGEELARIARHDPDHFNRWDALQRLGMRAILAVLDGHQGDERVGLLVEAFASLLDDAALDPAFKQLVLTLPAEGFVIEQLELVDPVAVRAALRTVRVAIATALQPAWQRTAASSGEPWTPDPAAAGRRALANLALAYWADAGDPAALEAARERFEQADNMTDRSAALAILVNSASPHREAALAAFESRFGDDPLVMDKWFTLQATMHRQPDEPPVLERVLDLMTHPAFSIRNPNKVRALVGAFCNGNPAEFHAADGSGYAYWAEMVASIDALNPQLAARLARAMDRWRKFEPARQAAMIDAVRRLSALPDLSPDVAEILGRTLGDAEFAYRPSEIS